MNTTSLQTNQYNFSHQNGIHGTSGLKVLAGEDLSTIIVNFSIGRSKKNSANAIRCMVEAANGGKITKKQTIKKAKRHPIDSKNLKKGIKIGITIYSLPFNKEMYNKIGFDI